MLNSTSSLKTGVKGENVMFISKERSDLILMVLKTGQKLSFEQRESIQTQIIDKIIANKKIKENTIFTLRDLVLSLEQAYQDVVFQKKYYESLDKNE
jgi:hypothetical protein